MLRALNIASVSSLLRSADKSADAGPSLNWIVGAQETQTARHCNGRTSFLAGSHPCGVVFSIRI
jgi:hypothetical protein